MTAPPLPVTLRGTATPFKGNGRRLGYPTANLAVPTQLPDGVYFGRADLAEYQKQPALIFIGVPTTVGDRGRRVEAHLLDIPDRDYYGQALTLRVQHFHRPNQRFADAMELQTAMRADERAARAWFAGSPLASDADLPDTKKH